MKEKKWTIKKILNTRAGSGVFWLASSLVITILLTLFFSCIWPEDGDYWELFSTLFLYLYLIVGAGAGTVGILYFFPSIPEKNIESTGLALYYLTAFFGVVFSSILEENVFSFVLAFVIAALVCYIFYLKRKIKDLLYPPDD